MTPRTLLHVGLTKTGSTSLQNFLDAQREALLGQGVLFPASVFTRKVSAQPERTSGHLQLVRDISAGDVSAFEAERRGTPHERLLLSAENLFHYPDEAPLAVLRDLLGDSAVTLLVVLRRQDAWLASRYLEAVRGGWERETRSFDHFARDMLEGGQLDFAAGMNRMIRLFRPEAIRVIDYDAATRGKGLLPAFLDAAGLSFPPETLEAAPRSNAGRYSPAALEAHRRLNLLAATLPGDGSVNWAAGLHEAWTSPGPEPLLLPEPATWRHIAAAVALPNAEISERFLKGAPFGPAEDRFAETALAADEDRVGDLVAEGLGRLLDDAGGQAPAFSRPAALALPPALEPADVVRIFKEITEARSIVGYETTALCALAAMVPGRRLLFAERDRSRAIRVQAEFDRGDPPSRPLILSDVQPADLLHAPGAGWPDLVLVPASLAPLAFEACRDAAPGARLVIYPDAATPEPRLASPGFDIFRAGRLLIATRRPAARAKPASPAPTVLPYRRSAPAAYRDLLVVQGPDAARSRPLPFLHALRHHGVALFADAPLPERFDSLFVGFARVGDRLVEGPGTLAGLGVADAAELIPLGPYVLCTAQAEGALRLEADPFGLGVLYIGRFGENVYASNRLHLLVEAAHGAGHRIAVDQRALCARWFLDSGLCLSQTTPRTLVAGVEVLLPGQRLDFRAEGAAVVDAPAPDNTPLTAEAYRALVAAGAEEIRANVAAIHASGEPVTSALTGGRDSRMVYAALVSLGLQDQVHYHTLDIEADMPIASGLLARYGGAFDDRPLEGYAQRPFQSLLQDQVSLGMGAYDDMSLMSAGTPDRSRTLLLSGGGGELYRAIFGSLQRFADTPVSEAGMESFLDGFPDIAQRWPPDLRASVKDTLGAFLATSGEETMLAALQWHYRVLDSRFQFGLSCTLSDLTGDERQLMPLCSPSLLEAAKRMPLDMRMAGCLVFDVTRHLVEEMAYLPYDTGPLDRAAYPWHVPGRYDGVPLDLAPDEGAWHAARNRRYGEADLPVKMSVGHHERLDDLRDETAAILRLEPALARLLTPALLDKFAFYRKRGHRFGAVWASRLHVVENLLRFGGGIA